MKKKIQSVKNYLAARKENATKKLAEVNTLTDEQKTALNGIVDECNTLIAELDAMEEETSNAKLLELVNNILASFAGQMEEMKAENLANLQKLQNQLKAKNEKKTRKRMRILENKMKKGVATNYTDLSDWTPDTDTDYVAGYRAVTGMLKGFTIGTTTKQSRKVRSLSNEGESSFVAVSRHGLKPVVELTGSQKIANMSKFAGIIQGVADEDIYEDGELVASIEREALAELDACKNAAAMSLLSTAAENTSGWTAPFTVTTADMRTAILAAITWVRLQMGKRQSAIAVAMNPAQWALLEDLRNTNGTPISADLILNQVVRVDDASLTSDNILVWAVDMAVYDIYRPAEMKWHDDGVRVVAEDDAEFNSTQAKLTALVGEDEVPYVVNAYTAWQVNEQDLLCEEMGIMYLRDDSVVFGDTISNIESSIAAV